MKGRSTVRRFRAYPGKYRVPSRGYFSPSVERLIERRMIVWGCSRSMVIVSAVQYAFGVENEESALPGTFNTRQKRGKRS